VIKNKQKELPAEEKKATPIYGEKVYGPVEPGY